MSRYRTSIQWEFLLGREIFLDRVRRGLIAPLVNVDDSVSYETKDSQLWKTVQPDKKLAPSPHPLTDPVKRGDLVATSAGVAIVYGTPPNGDLIHVVFAEEDVRSGYASPKSPIHLIHRAEVFGVA